MCSSAVARSPFAVRSPLSSPVGLRSKRFRSAAVAAAACAACSRERARRKQRGREQRTHTSGNGTSTMVCEGMAPSNPSARPRGPPPRPRPARRCPAPLLPRVGHPPRWRMARHTPDEPSVALELVMPCAHALHGTMQKNAVAVVRHFGGSSACRQELLNLFNQYVDE